MNRTAARVAGLTGLLTMVIIVAAQFGIQERIVTRDAGETARNILANARLFRWSIALELVYSGGLLVLAAALYVLLEPVNRLLAATAAVWRIAYAITWIVMTLNLLRALRLIGGHESLRVFSTEQLQAFARLYLRNRVDEYYVGLLFYAVAATATAVLFLKSRYIPKSLSLFGVVASAWCAFCTVAFIVEPNFSGVVNLWWFDSPMALFEFVTSFWLLFKGGNQ